MRRFVFFWVLVQTVHLVSSLPSFVQQSQAVLMPDAASVPTTTPIRHLVVIFNENNSFDHYFGTYPNAANQPGEPAFHARPDTPTVNGLTDALINNNPNSAAPFRLARRLRPAITTTTTPTNRAPTMAA